MNLEVKTLISSPIPTSNNIDIQKSRSIYKKGFPSRIKSIENIEQDFWMSILLDVGIGLEINVLTSKFILLGDQMLGEIGCHPEICFYLV